MKPVMQTEFGKGRGNCFSACIASLLEVPVEEVPNFVGDSKSDWFDACNRWLGARGLACAYVPLGGEGFDPELQGIAFPGIVIASGTSPRGLSHAVLWAHGEIVHDPHPEGGGIDRVRRLYMLCPADPAKLGEAA